MPTWTPRVFAEFQRLVNGQRVPQVDVEVGHRGMRVGEVEMEKQQPTSPKTRDQDGPPRLGRPLRLRTFAGMFCGCGTRLRSSSVPASISRSRRSGSDAGQGERDQCDAAPPRFFVTEGRRGVKLMGL